MTTRRSFLCMCATAWAFTGMLQAATPAEQPVVIQIKAMHCAVCAKKISQKLQAVAGVRDVKADVKKDLALVAPHKSASPSPRALWEAVEAAGFKPVKISGPIGTYTAKPEK